MSTESLVFLLLVLALWGLVVGAKWLQEQIEQPMAESRGEEPRGSEWTTRQDEPMEAHTPKLNPPTVREDGALSSHVESGRVVSPSNIKMLLRSNRVGTLRQGMILMTILGPCRAYKPSGD